MIEVPELDIYLKSIFYVLNNQAEFYSPVHFSNTLKSRIGFINNNQGMFKAFEDTVRRPVFAFDLFVSATTSMFGEKEFRNVRDPILIMPAQYLKVYPRLIYATGFLTQPSAFDSFKYFLRYSPKLIVHTYKRVPDSPNFSSTPSVYWTLGSHTVRGSERLVSYNVNVHVDIGTIVEEELHGQDVVVHGTPAKEEVINSIRNSRPELIEEIEANLNFILSAEEKRFRELGDILRTEYSSELRVLQDFVELFEKEVIESTVTPA